MRKVAALLLILVSATSVSPAFADTPEGADPAFSPLSDSTTHRRALMLYELEQRASAGDTDALNTLTSMGNKIKEMFPNGSLVRDAWSNALQVAVDDWRNRRGLNESGLPRDNSAQLPAAAGGGLVPYRNPAPAFSRNILVTRDEGTPVQNEPYLCVDPEDSKHLIVVSHNYGYNAAPAEVSFDGGETWTTARHVPISEQAIFSGDPVVSCARGEKAYYNFMSLGQTDYMLLNQAVSILRSDIAVSASWDGGMAWQQPSVVDTNHLGLEEYPLELPDGSVIDVPVIAASFLDKPWMSLGPNPDDPEKDMLYVSYTKFVDYFYVTQPIPGIYLLIFLQATSEIVIRSSADGGKTWQDTAAMQPVPAISDVIGTINAGVAEITWRTIQGSQLAVADDGTVYAAWYDSLADGYSMGKARYYVVESSDTGKTWSEPTVAAEVLETQRNSRSAPFRAPGNPAMAAGRNGEVYLAFPARTPSKPEDDSDVYFVRGEGSNGRLAFNEPVLINQDDTNNVQFFPAITVSPDGAIHMMWGDARDDPAGLKYNIYYSKSDNRGDTWGFDVRGIHEPDTRVTDFPSNPNKGFPGGRFIGDYFGIAATDSEVYMVWTDTRLGEYGPFNSKIGFSRRRAMQSPSAVLNPSSGPAGKSIAVQAYGFQPDMSVFVQVGSDIAFCGRTSDSGTVECNAVMPFMAPEQSQQVILFDESGNVATTSYFVEGDKSTADSTQDNALANFAVGIGIGAVLGLALSAFMILVFFVFRRRTSTS
ncbi:hypothetical protein A2797_01845 [candidate division WWE3 bacterium RIFCSPHIGHO2_01_FULL_48_15]|uniref:Sialidase domain-containing protein n=1 Tax=candidate division WWE3 bacterium RIFCSPHIGHO2_01_FULL_48_15 TaxID=1802619 RepID=A0A1F4VH64_UNCKA|nr:MAG: hypothetical protein A2797_01845 [candidate division WWE3 bacterium RIFCSPHIGHO2_01_FULL_48_15]